MLKKLIALSLVAALSIPVTGAFASDYINNDIARDTQNFNASTTTATKFWTVITNANMRATPSRTGAHILSLYPGDKLQGGTYTVVANGETWGIFMNPNGIEVGYVLLSSLSADN